MREKNIILDFVAKVLLVCMGTLGILEIFISCASADDIFFMSSMLVIILAVVMVICMSGKGRIRLGILFIIAAIINVGLLNFATLKTGAQVMYNDIVKTFNKTSDMNFSVIRWIEVVRNSKDGTHMLYTAEIQFIIYLAVIITYIVAVEVVYIKSAVGSLVVILPFFLLFITFDSVPDILSITLCTVFIFADSAFIKKGDWKRTAIIVVIGLVIVSVFEIAVPKQDFKRLPVFVNANNIVDARYGNLFKASIEENSKDDVNSITDSNTNNEADKNTEENGGRDDIGGNNQNAEEAVGGINGGILGRINSIRYSKQDMMHVNTIDTGKNQYIKQFVGQDYSNNTWSKNEKSLSDDLPVMVAKIAENGENIQNYLFGSQQNYYNNVMLYQYSTTNLLTNENITEEAVNINTATYKMYEDLKNRADMQRKKLNLNSSPIYYGDAVKVIEDQTDSLYTQVPDNIKALLSQMLGGQNKVNISTTQEREAYIEYVKKYLKDNYRYTISPGKVPAGKDFVEYFLNESKQGYCTYFATAATMMFRYAGIPARYVEGYVIREEDIKNSEKKSSEIKRGNDGFTQEITRCDLNINDTAAHAWVEVYMSGYGWVVEEVTPPVGIGSSNVQNYEEALSLSEDNIADGQQNSGDTVDNGDDLTSAENQTQSSTATDVENNMDSGELSDLSENVMNNDNGTGKILVLLKVLSVAAVFVICAALIVAYFNMRYNRRRERMYSYYKDRNISDLYHIMEQVLAFCNIERSDNVDYEVYAEYLDAKSEICHEHDIKAVTDIMLEYAFGNKSSSEMDKKKLEYAADHIVAIIDAYVNGLDRTKKCIVKYTSWIIKN